MNLIFISFEELYREYLSVSFEERENIVVRKYGVVFIYKIGYILFDGLLYLKRVFDYDDWNLNGDLVFYDVVNDAVLEILLMGIRVDVDLLIK